MAQVKKTYDDILLSSRTHIMSSVMACLGRGFLFAVTSISMLAVLFIFIYIGRDALPFFQIRGFKEFFTGLHWYPSAAQAEFGALSIITGSMLVTIGAAAVAVPLGVCAAVCLSDLLPFSIRQMVKPVIEMLAAIPSVAYGFFALVVFAPILQEQGGNLLSIAWRCTAYPSGILLVLVLSDLMTAGMKDGWQQKWVRGVLLAVMAGLGWTAVENAAASIAGLKIISGTNALNVSIILGIMALPTVVSVSEDALQSVGRELREGSYALGATRAETLVKTVMPAASSGIAAAVLLGIMRAVGETMVVWMASGNSAQIPSPIYNYLTPVRTLTATIAGDMGEADHVTGSARYHVLFAMGLLLLAVSFVCNMVSEGIVRRQRRKLKGE